MLFKINNISDFLKQKNNEYISGQNKDRENFPANIVANADNSLI